MPDPRPPENVRVVLADGREVPVECVYDGFRDGTHHWLAAWSLPERPVSVMVAMLPAHTAVALSYEDGC